MKVSNKTDYALRTVLYLARRGRGEVVSVSDISTNQNIPAKFLEQILSVLKRGGIVNSRRGKRGGYSLARDASEISVSSIVELTEDSFLSSAKRRENRIDRDRDPFEEIWIEIDRYILKKLNGASIQDMSDRAEELMTGGGQNYVI